MYSLKGARMSIMGMQMPVKNSHIRAVELMTEFLRLSHEQREKAFNQFLEAANAKTMPVEVSFKAAIVKLKV